MSQVPYVPLTVLCGRDGAHTVVHLLANGDLDDQFVMLIDDEPVNAGRLHRLAPADAAMHLLARVMLCREPNLTDGSRNTLVPCATAFRYVCPGLDRATADQYVTAAANSGLAVFTDNGYVRVTPDKRFSQLLLAIQAYNLGMPVRLAGGETFATHTTPANIAGTAHVVARAQMFLTMVLRRLQNSPASLESVMVRIMDGTAATGATALDDLMREIMQEDPEVLQLLFHFMQGASVQANRHT